MSEADAAELAWERSAEYSWQGQDLTWSKRHRWFTLTVARYAMHTSEQDHLLAMWVGLMDEAGLRSAQRQWRISQEATLENFYEWASEWDENSPETEEAGEVFRAMWEDVDASTNTPAGGNGGDPDEWDGSPKKSAPAPAMSTSSEPLPD